MTNIATKFGLNRATGVNFTDPKKFDRNLCLSSGLRIFDSSVSGSASTAAGFFTNGVLGGVDDDTNWTADTYKTLLNVSSGSGLLGALVGPTALAGTPTVTWRITVDGTAHTVAVVHSTTAQRAVLGAAFQDGGAGSFYTSGFWPYRAPDSVSSDKTTQRFGSGLGLVLPPWATIRALNIPVLEYTTSLLVECKTSETNSTTTNQERRALVTYKPFS